MLLKGDQREDVRTLIGMSRPSSHRMSKAGLRHLGPAIPPVADAVAGIRAAFTRSESTGSAVITLDPELPTVLA
jgi:hypothetical protein